MSLERKTKTALDESRTLMLGAQILLGFQLNAPFQNAFDTLSQEGKLTEAVVLAIMAVVVGLLIAPSAYHRIVYGGKATAEITRLITRFAVVTLLLFSLALGLDVFIALSRIGGADAGVAGGLATGLVAVLFWFGPAIGERRRGGHDMAELAEKTSTSTKIDYVLTEARVVLPGAQALLGFQLAIVLTQGFAGLSITDKWLHAGALAFVALATILLISPASYHRIAYNGADDPAVHRVASWLLLAATVALGIGLCLDIFVVMKKSLGSPSIAAAAAFGVGAVLFGLWHIWPLLSQLRRHSAPA
jgi:hypothetical protein